MYESSGSQFFRTTTGIQSGPDVFYESRFVMIFLTILGVMEILCSFRLVLYMKTGKEIHESSRLEFLENFSANNFENWETLSRWKKVQIIEVQIRAILLNYYWFNFFCHTLSLNYSSLTRDMNRTSNLTTRAFLQNAFISTVITYTLQYTLHDPAILVLVLKCN